MTKILYPSSRDHRQANLDVWAIFRGNTLTPRPLCSPWPLRPQPMAIFPGKISFLTSHMHKYQRRQWHPTPVLLPGKSHGRRSLVASSPWGRTESDTTERLHFHFSLSCIGEGNGNPLQCSCLENPRDGEAWWAAVYGVAESRTCD